MTTNNKKSKRGPGRPEKPKGQGKEVIKPVRFTEGEFKAFEREARKNDQNFSEWVRETLRRAIGK